MLLTDAKYNHMCTYTYTSSCYNDIVRMHQSGHTVTQTRVHVVAVMLHVHQLGYSAGTQTNES